MRSIEPSPFAFIDHWNCRSLGDDGGGSGIGGRGGPRQGAASHRRSFKGIDSPLISFYFVCVFRDVFV